VMNVLLLLGGSPCSSTSSSSSSGPIAQEHPPSMNKLNMPQAVSVQRRAVASGCPPNAPLRRLPPVMLLPANELPGLLMAA
jgi:hypothetical protein